MIIIFNTVCLSVVLLAAASCGILTVLYVNNLVLALAILVFALLVLLVTIPIFGLALRVLPATTWLRAYVEVLERIPGLRRVVHAAGALRPSPNQLPNDLTDFSGRTEQITTLHEFLTGATGAVAGIYGMPGVGKSALAVHLAHQLVDAASDGRIYIDMSGTSPKPVTPLTPLAAMTRVIQILHPQESLPVELELVQSLYRSCLEDKRALLLLDNVDESPQVVPLLEWSAENTLIIITSRQAIPEAELSLELELMNTAEARDLLEAVLHGLPASQGELEALADRCGKLPLALRAAGTFLTLNKDWDVGEYIEALKDERERPELRFGDAKPDVYAVLSFSARQLMQSELGLGELWRMLAVFPASFDRIAAAAVWNLKKEKARQALSNLLRGNMIMYDKANKRYRLHDLMRDVAALPFEDEDEGAVRQQQKEAAARHARYFSGVLTECCNLHANGETAAALDLYDVEQRNIGAGQTWAVDNIATPNGHNKEAARLACDYAYRTHQLLALRLPSLERVRWLCGAFQASSFTR